MYKRKPHFQMMKMHNVPKEFRRLTLLDGETPEDEHNETTAICVIILALLSYFIFFFFFVYSYFNFYPAAEKLRVHLLNIFIRAAKIIYKELLLLKRANSFSR